MMRIDGCLSSSCRALSILLAASLAAAAGCASAPATKGPPPVPTETKLAEILQLEDQRILRVVPPPPPPVTERRRGRAATPPPPVPPDLTRLLADIEPRVRRRAALGVGRVGLPEGVQPLTAALKDADPEVRQMAAFALGLIGDTSGVPPRLLLHWE